MSSLISVLMFSLFSVSIFPALPGESAGGPLGGRSKIFWATIHMLCLYHLTWSFLGLCIQSQIFLFPLSYTRRKSELDAELKLSPRITFALIAVLTSCLTPWQTPLSHIRLFKVYPQRLVVFSGLSASPISFTLSRLTSETQLISFRCLSLSPTARIC